MEMENYMDQMYGRMVDLCNAEANPNDVILGYLRGITAFITQNSPPGKVEENLKLTLDEVRSLYLATIEAINDGRIAA